MEKWQKVLRMVVSIGVLAGMIAALFMAGLPDKMPVGDFRAYWTATYLLRNRLDFSDPQVLYQAEQVLTGWQEEFVLHAWIAPSGNFILLPYTFLSFRWAAWLWLWTNVFLVTASAILIWHKKGWPLAVFLAWFFSFTLTSVAMGQVNTLVLFGLALFLFLQERKQAFWSGAGLAVTTVKPHLVIITLPLLLLMLWRRRQWQALGGFLAGGAVAAATLTLVFPKWLALSWRNIGYGASLVRYTPTLNGVLALLGQANWGKWLWLLVLAGAVGAWGIWGRDWNWRDVVDVSLLAGLAVAPFGWSYDQIMLLFPIWRVFQWGVTGALPRRQFVVASLAFVLLNALAFWLRARGVRDISFVWTPFAVAVVYGFAYWGRRAADARE